MTEAKSFRQKNWGELTTEEKIERLRHEVKGNNRTIERLRKQVRELMRHKHLGDDLVTDISSGSYGESESSGREPSDEVYF